MRYLVTTVSLVLLTLTPAINFAQDEMDVPGGPAPAPLKSYTGLSWGAAHTIWNGRWSNEGYPEAGTLGPLVSLRKISPINSKLAIVPYLTYYVLNSRVSVSCDTCANGTQSIRTYFREIDLGLNLQATPWPKCPEWYFGGGPSVRWGQSGRRVGNEQRPGTVRKAAWFGLTALVGYRFDWGKSRAVFFEPQLTFSPDFADRWQRNYPPDVFNVQMGFLW